MPLDPKFNTTAGLQRYREQIYRENKCRITSGQKPSEAALEFLRQRKKILEEEIRQAEKEKSSVNKAESNTAVNASKMGVRGTAGRSGVASSTQRHVVDEGYDMVLKTEWGAASEGVNSKDPVFLDLNDGTVGASARTLHVQREESARRVNDTRARMIHDREAEQEWIERAHHIVDEGWERAKHSSLSKAAPSDYMASKARSLDGNNNSSVASSSNNNRKQSSIAGMSGVPGATVYISTLQSGSGKPQGLKSEGVRAPTYTKERHEDLTRRVRGIYERPPPPRKDIFAALDHITKTSLPKRNLTESDAQQERKDRQELENRVDALSKQLATEKAATGNMVKKLDDLTKLAAQP